MRGRAFGFVALVTAGIAACYEAPPPKEPKEGVTAESLQGRLRHRSLLLANNSNFRDPSLRVIQYPEDYDEAWRSGFTNVGGLRKPPVNFDSEMVILVTTGTRPRSGYLIKVDSVVAGADLAIHVTESQPGPNCKTLDRIGSPAQIVTIPWMEKTPRFIEARTVSNLC